MNTGTNTPGAALERLLLLPEEISLEQVRGYVLHFPLAYSPARYRRWFSLNTLLLISAGSLLFGLGAFWPKHHPSMPAYHNAKVADATMLSLGTGTDLATEPAPRPDPWPNKVAFSIARASNQSSTNGEGKETSSVPYQLPHIAKGENSAGDTLGQTGTAEPIPALLQVRPARSETFSNPEKNQSVGTTAESSEFHVVVRTTDRQVRNYVCVPRRSLAKPGVHDENLIIRTEVIVPGSFKWHIVGGTGPYAVVSVDKPVVGTVCVTVKDATGRMAQGCGVIQSFTEQVAVNCPSTADPDSTWQKRYRSVSGPDQFPDKPKVPETNPSRPEVDSSSVNPPGPDPRRNPVLGPFSADTGCTPSRPHVQDPLRRPDVYRPPVPLPSPTPAAPPPPSPNKEKHHGSGTRPTHAPQPPGRRSGVTPRPSRFDDPSNQNNPGTNHPSPAPAREPSPPPVSNPAHAPKQWGPN
jgi:hypothetical protein